MKNVGPDRRDVMKTYCEPARVGVKTIDYEHACGQVDLEVLSKEMNKDVAAVYVENPNFFGVFEEKISALLSNLTTYHQ